MTRAADGSVAARRVGTPGSSATLALRQAPELLGELARVLGADRVAVRDPQGGVGRRHVGPGEGPPAAADGVEHRLGERRRQVVLEQLVDAPPRLGLALGQHGLHRQGAQRQADRALADPVVQDLGDLEAAAAHVADEAPRPVEAGDDAERGVARLLGPAQDADLEARLLPDGGHEPLAVAGAADRLGRDGVDPAHAHGVRDGAEAAGGLDRAAEPFRRELARAVEALAEAAERLLVEARERGPAQLVVDDEPDRVGADVDHRVVGALRAGGALGVELERPRGPVRRAGSVAHRSTPPCLP